jgi:hypothetical protein
VTRCSLESIEKTLFAQKNAALLTRVIGVFNRYEQDSTCISECLVLICPGDESRDHSFERAVPVQHAAEKIIVVVRPFAVSHSLLRDPQTPHMISLITAVAAP